jgi:predicted enzyme related to lactoylglutathione lyase
MARIEIIVSVASVEETVEWYERVLGWKGSFDVYDKDDNCLFGEVITGSSNSEDSQSSVGFNLARSSEAESRKECNWLALVYVEDIETLYHKVVENSGNMVSGLEDQPWGARIFKMVDLNGVRLTFAQMMESPSIEEIQRRINSQQQ